jgi:hypothetical protein
MMLICTAFACGPLRGEPPPARPKAEELAPREDTLSDALEAAPKVGFGLNLYLTPPLKRGLQGIGVQRVFSGTPAEGAGFEVFDVITHVDAKRIKNMQDWRKATASLEPGAEVRITVRRWVWVQSPNGGWNHSSIVLRVTPAPFREVEEIMANEVRTRPEEDEDRDRARVREQLRLLEPMQHAPGAAAERP